MVYDCIIAGTGPAALFAADRLCDQGIKPVLFEKRRGPGWKLLVAGSSGLNITYDAPHEQFVKFYHNRQLELGKCLEQFGPKDWLNYLKNLGEESYLGTSRRYFLKNFTASSLLKAWTESIEAKGAKITYDEELQDFSLEKDGLVNAIFVSGRQIKTKALLLALGGTSWEEIPSKWPEALQRKGIIFEPFTPSNAGFHLDAAAEFFQAAEGKAIKGLILTTKRGSKQGELMITKYGLEGTPVYSVGCSGPAHLDLKPDLEESKLLTRLKEVKGQVWKKIERGARLSEGALLLLKHLAPAQSLETIESAVHLIKNFPITLLQSRPISESISSRGGLSWDELNDHLELKKYPGIYCVGEMVDWDAPTGGFLLQACVSMAHVAANNIVNRLSNNR